MGKKNGNAKQAWLDWLADDPPAPDAKSDLRERFKQQANSYQPGRWNQQPGQPVNRAHVQTTPPPPVAPAPQPSVAPHRPVQGVAAPQPAPQPQAITNTAQILKQPPEASKSATPATVSIQIHIPALQTERFRRLVAKLKQGITSVKRWILQAKVWFLHQLATHRTKTLAISIGVPLVILLLFVPPLFNFGYGKPKASSGTASGSSAGATVKYDKPPFQVVTPSTKTKLATPDGVHAAYDGAKNSYTYADSIGGNGFTVSQQPLPAQFKDGQTAVESIGPTLNKGVTPVSLDIITGQAALSTNPKYNSQAVVAVVRNVLLFIQSAHAFKTSEWQDYLNTLQ